MKMTKFQRLSRGLIIRNGQVLVAKGKGYDHTFLPGGHVEATDGAEEALLRRLQEEIRVETRIIRFLGDIEHEWESSKDHNFEINHVFELDGSGFDQYFYFSQDTQLDYFWVKKEDLQRFNLQPSPLIELIDNLDTISAFWKNRPTSSKR